MGNIAIANGQCQLSLDGFDKFLSSRAILNTIPVDKAYIKNIAAVITLIQVDPAQNGF